MSMLVDFRRAISTAGLDCDEMMRLAGMPMDRLGRPTERFPLRVLAKLINIASAQTGDPLFGVRLGLQTSPRSLGTVGTLVTLAPTLRAAIDGAGRYLHLHNSGPSLVASTDGRQATVSYRIPPLVGVDSRHYAEYAIASCLRMITVVVGEDWLPARIILNHALRVPKNQYETSFGASVIAKTGLDGPSLVFPAEALDARNPLTDPLAHAALERHLAEQVRLGQDADDLLERIRHQISRNLLDGESHITIGSVARNIGFSVRTLQRRLTQRDTSFDELLDEIRQDWARHYLENSRLTVSDVAYLLGYGELSSFTRAFHRWTGESPTDYRRSHRQAPCFGQTKGPRSVKTTAPFSADSREKVRLA